MRLTTPALGLVVLTSALGLSACGGSGDDEIAVAALGSPIAFQLPAAQAKCTAQKIVDTVGVEKLTKVGALTDDYIAQLNGQFDKDVATKIADATVACWDWRKNTETWASQYPTADATAWDTYVACAEKLDDQLHASILAANLKGGSAAPREAFAKAEAKCREALGPATTK
jgi:hypothetical protein